MLRPEAAVRAVASYERGHVRAEGSCARRPPVRLTLSRPQRRFHHDREQVDAPLGGDSKTTYQEVLRDERVADSGEELDRSGTGYLVREMLSELPVREAQVITGLFGMDQNAPLTLREVGLDLNISHERVRQLRDQALRRIRLSGSFSKLENRHQGHSQAAGK